MAIVLDGKKVTQLIDENTKNNINNYLDKPKLALLNFSDDVGAKYYLNNIVKNCVKYNIDTLIFDCKDWSIESIKNLCNQDDVSAIMPLQPMPKDISDILTETIPYTKDVDCFSKNNIAHYVMGKNIGFLPCTPEAVLSILDYYEIDVTSKNIVIVGRSLTVGMPLSILLTNKNATVTLCHSKTKDLQKICKTADILISCVGKAKFINKDYINENSIVIDIGINKDKEGKICGDVDYSDVEPIVKAITPVPGGVGVVTTSILMNHISKKNKIKN